DVEHHLVDDVHVQHDHDGHDVDQLEHELFDVHVDGADDDHDLIDHVQHHNVDLQHHDDYDVDDVEYDIVDDVHLQHDLLDDIHVHAADDDHERVDHVQHDVVDLQHHGDEHLDERHDDERRADDGHLDVLDQHHHDHTPRRVSRRRIRRPPLPSRPGAPADGLRGCDADGQAPPSLRARRASRRPRTGGAHAPEGAAAHRASRTLARAIASCGAGRGRPALRCVWRRP